MKASNLYLSIFFFFIYFFAHAQMPNIQITSNSNGLVKYHFTDVAQQTYIFTLFGDGTFSSLQQPEHKFEPSTTGYTTEVYFAKAYDPNLPPKRIIHTGQINSGNPFVNPTIHMTGDIDILTSWAIASGYENYYIIAFRNTTSTLPLLGCIEFYYNTQEIDVNFQDIKVYNNWVYNRTIDVATGMYDQKIKWNFKNLKYNETRYIYVPAKTLKPVGELINVEANYKVRCDSDSGIRSTGKFLTKRYPHDPNFKIVNKKCLIPNLNEKQQLIYTISFFNDGNDFAKDVYVEDDLSNYLDENTISLVDYEVQPSYTVNNGTLAFNFSDIYLPGTNQTIPKIFSYDDASTYFSFKICAKPQLNTCISNTGKIVFDSQPAFFTNIAKTCTDTECITYDSCNPIEDNQVQSKPIKLERRMKDIAFNVHPNPASNQVEININFNSKTTSNFSIQLMDYSGRIVEQLIVNDNYSNIFTEKISLKKLSNGLYFITLETDHGQYTKKVIKI